MLKLFRILFSIPKPRIQRDEALKIAESFFQHQGVEVHNPQVNEEMRSWMILADGNIIGSSWVRIDNQQGKVIDFGIPPR